MIDNKAHQMLTIRRTRELAQTLTAIGTKVPAELTKALSFATIKHTPGEPTRKALSALQAAETKQDVAKALDALALAYATDYAVTQTVEEALLAVQHQRVMVALAEHEYDLLSSLAAAFNAVAPSFEQACVGLPELGQPNRLDTPWALVVK